MPVPTVDARPGKLNIRVYRGDDLEIQITFVDGDGNPVDLTDYDFAAEAEDVYDPATATAITCTVSDADAGRLNLTMSAALTANLPDHSRWDLEVTYPDSTQLTWLTGTVIARDEVVA